MIWLTSCKTYASPPIYHLMKRFYLILNGLKRCSYEMEYFLKNFTKGRKLKETWALQGKISSKKPRLNRGSSEAQTGFEPVHQGVADPRLTAWLLRHTNIYAFFHAFMTPTGIEPVLPP